ncbi:MAG: 3'-5' exoribonuclease [Clostridia bacterium]|nr:3'-5' exoribonuclease [Clostridia bacterium]
MQSVCDILIEKLKNIDPMLGDLRFKKAYFDAENKTVEIRCVSDIAVPEDSVNFLKRKLEEELPSTVELSVKIEKSIVDASIAKSAIFKRFTENNQYVAHTVSAENVKIICAGKITKYDICVSNDIADYLVRTSAIERLDELLNREFSSNFSGNIRVVSTVSETPNDFEVESVYESDVSSKNSRTLKVVCPTRFCDSEDYDTAYYIEDAKDVLGEVIFAGYVQAVEQRESKNGRPYYLITLDDKTGVVTGRFFTTDKNKIKKLEKIQEGSIIIMRGVNETFNERTSLLIKGFNLCMLPNGYTPDEKPSKPIPEKYVNVFPQPAEIIKQGDIFSTYNGPQQCLLGKEFTVVDIESTGLDVYNDKVIEIGAVKIKDGEVVSSFHTLINPLMPLTNKIVELTGITDDMLYDAKTVEEVYPDFFKFVCGTTFVAHNADFDYKFLRNTGKQLGYKIDLPYIDTVTFARERVPGMKNYKLNTLCEKFKIEFRHHRALADAFATAELFLELVKIKGL